MKTTEEIILGMANTINDLADKNAALSANLNAETKRRNDAEFCLDEIKGEMGWSDELTAELEEKGIDELEYMRAFCEVAELNNPQIEEAAIRICEKRAAKSLAELLVAISVCCHAPLKAGVCTKCGGY